MLGGAADECFPFVGTAANVSPELLSSSSSKTTSQRFDRDSSLPVGQSLFLALNDYLSFKKIEALDYTIPDGFDSSARDLVQRLLVGVFLFSGIIC